MMIQAGRSSKQPVAICAQKSGFLEPIGALVPSTRSAFLPMARVVGRVIRVKRTVTVVAPIGPGHEAFDGGKTVEVLVRLEEV